MKYLKTRDDTYLVNDLLREFCGGTEFAAANVKHLLNYI